MGEDDRPLGIDPSGQVVGHHVIDIVLHLDQPGLARALSLPADSTSFTSDYVESYKVLSGVLHNPRNDRRTTAGVFHVAEGGLPIPDDKKAVPRDVFARILAAAVDTPEDLLTLPWASNQEAPARCFVSLLRYNIIWIRVDVDITFRDL